MPLHIDKNGQHWSKSKSEISRLWKCHSGTIDRYSRDARCPPKHKKYGWNLAEFRKHILDHFRPQASLREAMAEYFGEVDQGLPDSPKPKGFKDRIDFARAQKLEAEVAILLGDLVHIDVFAEFFADIVPKTVAELRRQMENVLPALQEGQTAAQIRKIHRKHIDKVLANFEKRAEDFQAQIQEKASKAKKAAKSKEETNG